MNRPPLKHLWQEAQEKGWAVGKGSPTLVDLDAGTLGWLGTSTRKGDPQSVRLRPQRREEAHPRSISAIHGLDTQPLHVDGTHMADPPDVVVLYSEAPNSTTTRLCHVQPKLPVAGSLRDSLEHGVFLVGFGPSAFLSTVLDARGLLRYDPGIMVPADQRARKANEYMAEFTNDCVEHEWTEEGMLLVINNRAVLHGRSAVSDADSDRALVRQAYFVAETA